MTLSPYSNTDPEPYIKDPTLEERVRRHLMNCERLYATYAALCWNLDETYKPTTRTEYGAWKVNRQVAKLNQAQVQIPLAWVAANVKSNILGMRPPRFSIKPVDRSDPNLLLQAEGISAIIEKIWGDEDMDIAHLEASRCMSVYGRAVLHDGIRNGETFTENVDQQYNVWASLRRLGEPEAISFAEVVSEQEGIDMGWDGTTMDATMRFNFPIYGGYDHLDPLGVMGRNWATERTIFGKVPVLHFYYQRKKYGNVWYAKIVNGVVVSEKNLNRKSWPFLIVDAEHAPGLPWGVGDVEPIIDIQQEVNEAMSDWREATRRNIKDQWKAWGLKHVTPTMVPGEGRLWELTDKTTDDIEPLKFPIDNAGSLEYINLQLEMYRRVSLIPPEAEGGSSGGRASGYAIQLKFEALSTSLEPRRIRMQSAYKQWALEKLKTIAKLYPQYKELIQSAKFTFRVVWPEITPKDTAQMVNTLAQSLAAGLESPYTAMDAMGFDPEEEMQLIREYNADENLNPKGFMILEQARMMAAQSAQSAAQGNPATAQMDQQAKEQALAQMGSPTEKNNQYNPYPSNPQGSPLQPEARGVGVGGGGR